MKLKVPNRSTKDFTKREIIMNGENYVAELRGK